MEALYNKTGFEQDHEPQVCLRGSKEEFEHFITIVRGSINDNVEGEIILLRGLFDVSSPCSVSFFNYDDGDQLMKKISDNLYSVSLNNTHWNKILELLKPLTKSKGYQFIEFVEEDLNSDVTWICQSSRVLSIRSTTCVP